MFYERKFCFFRKHVYIILEGEFGENVYVYMEIGDNQ